MADPLDQRGGTREGTRHLIDLGHCRIALVVSDPGLYNIEVRIEGYRRAVREAGLGRYESVLVAGQNVPEAVVASLKPVLLKKD